MTLIKKYEGFSPVAYTCPAGYPTIGYGSIWDSGGKRVTLGHPLVTPEEAEGLLQRELGRVEKAVRRLIQVELAQPQFDALCSFCYNLGSGALQASTLRAIINRQEWDEVPSQFMRWVWAGGRKLKGLIARRREEALLFMEGL